MDERLMAQLVDVAVRLRNCTDRAWLRLMTLPPADIAVFNTRTRSNMMHCYVAQEVEAEFRDEEFARSIEVRQLKQLVTNWSRIRFKKFSSNLLVSGNRTKQSRSWIQMPIPGVTELLSLTFGYRPDRFWSRLEKTGLALQVGDTVPWFLEVRPVAESDQPSPAESPTKRRSKVTLKHEVIVTRQAAMDGEIFRLGTGS